MKNTFAALSIATIFCNCLLLSASYAATPQEWVDAHNKLRRRHINTPDVVWDSNLAKQALACANSYANWGGSNLTHCGYGENWSSAKSYSAESITKDWYDEIDYYQKNVGYGNDPNTNAFPHVGHFTQVVWKSTAKIGCGIGNYGTVCNYSPYGNYQGQYGSNVMPKKSMGDDILWHHALGFSGIWYMNQANFKSGAWIGWTPNDWIIAGAADFNSDAKTDIVWRNITSGENIVWYMDGNQIVSHASLLKVPDLKWNIVGTGDFNGDGLTDLLWRHDISKSTAIWIMDGTQHTKSMHLPTSGHPDWNIVGAGDFNGDYHTDVLWQNSVSGQTAVWFVKNAQYQGIQFLPSAQTEWKISATGDLNSDNKTDILLRNSISGANAVWYLDGTTFKSYDWLPPVADLNYKMVGTGNFE